ncbi:MAG: 3'-5' exonuclease, partial [Pseudogulbenkiania sp.]|nr:3'-5' exonuclease [Pseudogulbenkiania sp.]
MLAQWQRRRAVRSLKDPAYRQLFEETPDEVVSLACETSSLDVKEAELLAIAAVRVQRNRIVASQSLYLLIKPARQPASSTVGTHGLRPRDVAAGLEPGEAMRRLLDFIGGRPLVGYYLDVAVAVLDKYA